MQLKPRHELTTPSDAKQRGFVPLTRPFRILDGEIKLRQSVLADMERGKIECVLVGSAAIHEIWRAAK